MSERESAMSSEAAETEESLGKLLVAELKDLCRQRGLRVSGAKSVLIARLLNEEQLEVPSVPLNISQHIVDLGLEEVEVERLEHKRGLLRAMKVNELKAILRGRGQKVGGKKEELIARLLGLEKTKPKSIEKSCIPKLLLEDIFKGNDLQDNDGSPMDAEALYHSRVQYRRYPLDEFADLLEKKREEYAENMAYATRIDELVAKQLNAIGGMAVTTNRGCISWRVHPAKELLRQDMEKGLHKSMSPALLFSTRDEYKTLHPDPSTALKVFRQRIAQEQLRIKQNNWNRKKEEENDDDSRGDEVDEWSETDEPQDLDEDDLESDNDED